MLTIRSYEPADRQAVLDCLAELQDHEAALEPDRVPGTTVAETHLVYVLDQCRQKRGEILVAVDGPELLGLVCVWTDEDFGEHYAVPAQAAYISDLIVRPAYRRARLGLALIRAAERFALANGARLITVNVLAANRSAREFYAAVGYREYEILLTRPLVDAPAEMG